ncbi:MAG: proline racemase family protein [Deltaproteobacteria bacterium]|nr:proline racemase family protein [Deltaproteobacteria bacterium]
MEFSRLISTIDAHTAGEPTRVVTGGLPPLPGKTMAARKQWLQSNMDMLRKTLMWEPRGHQDMFGAIITTPTIEDAQVGVIFMDSQGYLDMCGHGSIGAVTILLEAGIIPVEKKSGAAVQHVVLDTPAGRIAARADLLDRQVKDVTIQNVPAFFYRAITVKLMDGREVPVEIVYGGNFFGIVSVDDLGLSLTLENIKQLRQLGMDIRRRINTEQSIIHPGSGVASQVDLVEFHDKSEPARNVVVFGSGQIDRSPCGTGTCARMALLHAKGKLGVGCEFPHSSLFGTTFYGRIVEETTVGGIPAVVPEIRGRAFITGLHNFVVNEEDPFKYGFNPNSEIF